MNQRRKVTKPPVSRSNPETSDASDTTIDATGPGKVDLNSMTSTSAGSKSYKGNNPFTVSSPEDIEQQDVSPVDQAIAKHGKRNHSGKPSVREKHTRISQVMTMLARHARTVEIIAYMKEKYNVAPRTVNLYIKEARERMVRSIRKPKKVLQAESYHTYVAIIRDPETSAKEKLWAQNSIDKLLGLEIQEDVKRDQLFPLMEFIVSNRQEANAFLNLETTIRDTATHRAGVMNEQEIEDGIITESIIVAEPDSYSRVVEGGSEETTNERGVGESEENRVQESMGRDPDSVRSETDSSGQAVPGPADSTGAVGTTEVDGRAADAEARRSELVDPFDFV